MGLRLTCVELMNYIILCVGVALGLRWGCVGVALGVRWGCVGGALGVRWGCVGGALGCVKGCVCHATPTQPQKQSVI